MKNSLDDMVDLAAFTRPRRIAVVGGSRDATKMGGRLLRNMRRWTSDVPVEVVHPTAIEIAGFDCVASIAQLNEPDVAIVAVRQERVIEQLAPLADVGARAVVVIASGYADLGTQEGMERQSELAEECSRNGMLLLGPNTNGFLSVQTRVCATSNPGSAFDIASGGVGIVGQSGALSLGTILAEGSRYGLGFSHVFSTGNEAVITGWDVVVGLQEDPATNVIGIVIEGWRGVGRYIEYLRREDVNPKPVVALKIGRTDAGRQAATSHTAQIQTGATVDRGLLRQAGVRSVETLREFYAVLAGAQDASSGPSAQAGGLAIVSTSGGASGLAADLASEKGIRLAKFDEGTERRLRSVLPSFGTVQNPLDVTSVGVGDLTIYSGAIRELARSASVGAILAIVTVGEDLTDVRDELIAVAREHDADLSVAIMGGSVASVDWDLVRRQGVDVFNDIDEALDHIAGSYLSHPKRGL